jgi:predicted transcriptional regulator
VDDLCATLGQQGVHVRRDRDELRPGDLISEFMDRLASGDFVLAVISDKYLRSEYCMYELFRSYRNCADKPDRFLGKVVPLILPDARLDSLPDRLQRAIYWTQLKSVNGQHPCRFAEIHKALAEAEAGDFATVEEIAALNTTYQS